MPEIKEAEYTVYVKIDDIGRVTEINSSAFIPDISGWINIDNGCGDKYHHAQGNYLEHSIVDRYGLYNYKLVNGNVVLRSEADKKDELNIIKARDEIYELKKKLTDTDYIAAKIAEGAATKEEYSEQLAERALWRTRINELQNLYGT